MRNFFILLILILTNADAYSQPANSPYPVIFIHGLNSDDNTWSAMLTKISSAWTMSGNHTLNAILNAKGGDTTNYLQDVIIPLKDVTGNIVNQLNSSSIYAINFNNFWNRNGADPRIILYSNSTPGSNQNPSNQSAIYKQGCALGALIDSVLNVTGASRVVLIAHSMGGLAIREYLQRTENGIHKWWVNPYDSINGHKVAKVVTIGTPHLGTNVSFPIGGIDFKSEAIRDMRITYPSSSQLCAYLFGNLEANVTSNYYNKDINCNGIITDTVTGIDSNTTDNSAMPLPVNILYTWIMSNYLNLGTDGAVPLSSQAIYELDPVPAGVSDTLMTNKNHVQETGDVRTLIRGLDEPGRIDFAYDIAPSKTYSGYITLQRGGINSDTDYYKLPLSYPGKINVAITSVNAGVSSLKLLSDSGNVLVTKNITTAQDSILFVSPAAGTFYVVVAGNSSANPDQNNYKFTINFLPVLPLDLTVAIEGLWSDSVHVKDTLRIYLRKAMTPFERIDSATVYLDSNGNALAKFKNASPGYYYLQLSHRNALEVWTAFPVLFESGNVEYYDFTFSQSTAYGDNLVYKSGRWCIYSGDVDRTGTINLSDIVELYNDAAGFETGYRATDLTGDNIVNLIDLVTVYNNSVGFVTVRKP